MSHYIKAGKPEEYIWFPIDKLTVESEFEYNGEKYTAKMRINNRYLKCRDYGHMVLFDNLIVKSNVYKENEKVMTLTLNLKNCFYVSGDKKEVFFNESSFIKEAKMMYKILNEGGK